MKNGRSNTHDMCWALVFAVACATGFACAQEKTAKVFSLQFLKKKKASPTPQEVALSEQEGEAADFWRFRGGNSHTDYFCTVAPADGSNEYKWTTWEVAEKSIT